MMTFMQYMEMRATEGLWLNDKNAVPGMSKIIPPSPPKKSRSTAPPKIRPVHAPRPAKPCREVQLPDAMTALNRLGIDLLPPRNDEIEMMVEKDKRRPARRPARTASRGVTLAPSPTMKCQEKVPVPGNERTTAIS
jgi:hypothetical protein